MLLPGVSLHASWPEVRPEQVLAAAAMFWLVWTWWESWRTFRPSPIVWLLLAFALSILASTLYAPFVLDASFTPRDLYEVVKIGLYWLLFRFAWQVAQTSGDRTARGALRVVLASGAIAGLAALAQYYNVRDLNAWATPAWAPAHHLRTLAEDARAVGTVGNPNYFGMLAALVLLAAVAWLTCGAVGWDRLLSIAALGGGALGLITSASRGATLAFVVGLTVLLATLALAKPRRTAIGDLPQRVALATGAAAVALLLSVGLVEAAPRGRADYLTRMVHSFGADSDGSLALRLERWRGALPWTAASPEPATAPGAPLTYIQNGSLEVGAEQADEFRTIPGTRYELTDVDARFGSRSARFLGNPDEPEQRTAFFQQRYLGRVVGAPMTASLWVKLTGPVSGDLSLWVNLYYADGTRSDPHATTTVDTTRTGEWQELVASVRPDPARTVTFAGVYLMGENFRGEALVDGFQLVDGDQLLPFASLEVASPNSGSVDTAARLRQSPILGGGPGKAEEAGAVDNEYLTIAARYGLLGLTLYLSLWLAIAAVALRGVRHARGSSAVALSATTLAAVAAFLTFNIVAGSLLHLQLMALFWPLAGIVASCSETGQVPSAAID